MNVKSTWQKITASLLTSTIAVTFVPNVLGNNTVNAATTKDQSNTCLGTSQMASPAIPTASSAWSGSKVYYGTYADEPILFRVLDPSTSVYGGSTLFLDSDRTLFDAHFNDISPYNKSWEKSTLRGLLNGSFLNGFTDIEKAAIATSTGNGGCSYTTGSLHEDLYGSPVSVDDQVFLLDAAEITNEDYGYSSDYGWTLNSGTWKVDSSTVPNHMKDGSSDDNWWLRSAYTGDERSVGVIDFDGILYISYSDLDHVGVAPALNIDQSSIIFSSLISGDFNTVGAIFKLTIKDPDLEIAVPSGQQAAVLGTKVTVPYEIGGTNAGNATRASILVTDKEWDTSSATILIYDELGVNTDTSGTFTLPASLDLSGWGTDYHVYILAEDINDGHDGKDTDYASTPVELAAPVAVTTYTIDVNVMTYDSDGVTLITDIGGTASVDPTTVAAGDKVTVTATPNSGYTLKRIEWGNGLADGTDITDTKAFTVGSFKPVVDVYFQKIAYTVTVNSGTADVTAAAQGTTVTLTADAAPAGKEFDKWEIVSGTVMLADATSATTTFTMPAENVKVAATYKDIPVLSYTVVSGANGTWTEGDIVITIKRSEDDAHCINYFTGVKIDDKDLVSGTDYTAVAGSTVVTIKGSTLESLTKGGHTITVTFKDGTAVTSVTLKDKTSGTNAIPSTGETTSRYAGIAVLCFAASGAFVGVVLFERKKRNSAQ